jgi:hypothetical protein
MASEPKIKAWDHAPVRTNLERPPGGQVMKTGADASRRRAAEDGCINAGERARRSCSVAPSFLKRLTQPFPACAGWVAWGTAYPAGLDRFDRLLVEEAELLVDAEQPLEVGGCEGLAQPGNVGSHQELGIVFDILRLCRFTTRQVLAFRSTLLNVLADNRGCPALVEGLQAF